MRQNTSLQRSEAAGESERMDGKVMKAVAEEERTRRQKKEGRYLEELFQRYPKLEPVRESVWQVYRMLRDCFAGGHKLLVAGNGGSAADSEHIVGELMKGFVKSRPVLEEEAERLRGIDPECGAELAGKLQGGLPAIALTGHPGLSTAFLNDVDGSCVFAQQVYGYGQEGDVLLGISTSGNADNIYKAGVVAKAMGMKVAELSGRDGGRIRRIADGAIIVPETETFKIQELHLPIYHALCLELEEYFF